MTAAQASLASPPAVRRHGRTVPIVMLVVLLIGATVAGLALRRWAFEVSIPGRHLYDVGRNYNFGVVALDDGFLNVYEDQVRDKPDYTRKLDYPPLRLATFEAWAAWIRWTRGPDIAWEPDFSFHAFLMWHNTALEWLASLAALLIVRRWLRESARAELLAGQTQLRTAKSTTVGIRKTNPLPTSPKGEEQEGEKQDEIIAPFPTVVDAPVLSPWTGLIPAAIAFLSLWFDPGVLIIGHGWPSPNLWTIPYYLWTVYFCLCDWWFVAGLLLGVGAMLQGQQLFVAGVFVFWPLFAGRPMMAFRWASGFALAFALIASGWMVTTRPDVNLPGRQMNWPAIAWVLGSVLSLAVVGLRTTFRGRIAQWWFLLPAAGAMAILCWPALAGGRLAWAVPSAALLVSLCWLLDWKNKRYVLAMTLAACLFACIPLFGAGIAWWQIGFLYGTERFPYLTQGATNNLPAILQHYFGWHSITDTALAIDQPVLFGWPANPLILNIKEVLMGVFAILLLAASAAAAMQWRRRDRNLLVALVLPWVLFYTLPPQIIGRYAVFVAGIGAICIGRSLGMWLLVLMFSCLTVEQTALMMMGRAESGPDANPIFNLDVQDLFNRFNPGISWAVVLAACVFFWASFSRSRRQAIPVAAEPPAHQL